MCLAALPVTLDLLLGGIKTLTSIVIAVLPLITLVKDQVASMGWFWNVIMHLFL